MTTAQQPYIRNLYQQAFQGTLQTGEIMFWGDSITSGYTTAYTDPSQRLIQSLPGVVKKLLDETTFPTREGVYLFFTDQLADGRVSLGNYGIIPGGGGSGVWGSIYGSTGGSEDLVFTPGYAFDTIRVFYADQNAWAASTGWGYNIDGGANLANLSSVFVAGSPYVHYTVSTSSCPLGMHTVHITNPTSGTAIIAGIECYDSTKKAVGITNAGQNGSQFVNFSIPGLLEAINPDVCILDCSWNSQGTFYPSGPSKSGTLEFIGWWQNVIEQCPGDVIVCSTIPTFGSPGNYAALSYINSYLSNLAALNGCKFFDKFNRWGNGLGIVEQANGYYAGAVHPSFTGDIDLGLGIYQIMNEVGGMVSTLTPQMSASGEGGTGPILLSSIDQSGATTGQVAEWNGSTWAPATIATGGSGGAPFPGGSPVQLTTDSNLTSNTWFEIHYSIGVLSLTLPPISTNTLPIYIFTDSGANSVLHAASGEFIGTGGSTSIVVSSTVPGGGGGSLYILYPVSHSTIYDGASQNTWFVSKQNMLTS